ncbi:MAG: response regulator [Planctomycetota bacterium]|nr:response regulator [Planctomycetota bacterium]
MRLEDLTPAIVRRAVAIYLEIAWPGDGFPRPRLDVKDLESASTLDALFARFDPQPTRDRGSQKRHTLRLGNRQYPFMKFVVQEYLVDAEYFFAVDTHDELDVKPTDRDYPAWMELKRTNARLKREIEAAWARECLPTYGDLRVIAEGLAKIEREGEKRARLLVVDDETEVCKGLGALLRGRGYEVELAFDGSQVLERLRRDPKPDLLLLDFSMPEVDGEQVLRQVRADPRTRDLPVLLATASTIDLERIPKTSGVLRKPYPREVLFAMLSQLLERRPPS